MSDLIDRQAAIDAYGDWYVEEGTEDGFIGTVKQLLEGFPPAQLSTNLAQLGTDCISRQQAIKEAESWVGMNWYEQHLQKNVVEWLKELPSAQLDTYWKEQCQSYEQTINKLRESLSTQPEIIRCCECKYLQCNMRPDGYLPKGVDEFECRHWCGSCDPMDFCSYAERREVTT